MNSEYKAIDIVLIPPPDIAKTAVKINRLLNSLTGDNSLVLDLKSCIPHVSLAMGTVKTDSLESLSDELDNICKKYLPLEAGSKDFNAVKTSDNSLVSGIDIVKDDVISNLSEDIISAFQKYNLKRVSENMVYPDNNKITKFTIEYSSDYLFNSTGINFSPHITLGNGNIYDLKQIPVLPSKFIFENLAVCHLGNHCTCREILWQYQI